MKDTVNKLITYEISEILIQKKIFKMSPQNPDYFQRMRIESCIKGNNENQKFSLYLMTNLSQFIE